jgi:succinylarginine dihydrolase
LQRIFQNDRFFAHHQPLPLGDHFGDEGAANHTRFCQHYGDSGVEFFVYGKHAFNANFSAPQKYPARQTFEASQAIARLHKLAPEKTVFAQQNPAVIDQGVFHNDVISVGNRNVLFYHQQAFLDTEMVFEQIKKAYGSEPFYLVEVPTAAVSVDDAVKSYLFNSQLVSLDDNNMALIAPGECEENPRVKKFLDELISQDNPINHVKIYDVKQSMQNGGGPACLRQRVVLTEEEQNAANKNVFIDDDLFNTLNSWVDKHYRDKLSVQDLADPSLLVESRQALDELTGILGLGSVYPFQLNAN